MGLKILIKNFKIDFLISRINLYLKFYHKENGTKFLNEIN
jgi:hypothetical protein